MKIGVIRFPGTNCDRDVAKAIELAGMTPEYIWWSEEKLTDYDGIVIPGGFSYGDYLRAGAMASITPVIDGIKELVKEEKPVTAEDDLFFGEPEEEEEQIKPDKKKKNRHEHSHVNPYQQKAKQKEQKGYTPQRQYSFFDLNEE